MSPLARESIMTLMTRLEIAGIIWRATANAGHRPHTDSFNWTPNLKVGQRPEFNWLPVLLILQEVLYCWMLQVPGLSFCQEPLEAYDVTTEALRLQTKPHNKFSQYPQGLSSICGQCQVDLWSFRSMHIFSFFLLSAHRFPIHWHDLRFVHRPLFIAPVMFSMHGYPRSDALFSSLLLSLLYFSIWFRGSYNAIRWHFPLWQDGCEPSMPCLAIL